MGALFSLEPEACMAERLAEMWAGKKYSMGVYIYTIAARHGDQVFFFFFLSFGQLGWSFRELNSRLSVSLSSIINLRGVLCLTVWSALSPRKSFGQSFVQQGRQTSFSNQKVSNLSRTLVLTYLVNNSQQSIRVLSRRAERRIYLILILWESM